MATLVSIQSGNLTDSSTWGVVDEISLVNAESSSVTLTTGGANTLSFTPGAITVSGFCLKLSTTIATPVSGATVTVSLQKSGTDVSGTSITVNVIDIPNSVLTSPGGWVYFQFASSVTLEDSTAYTIRFIASNNSQVAFYRDSNGNNLSRLLVTTTNQAPTDDDSLIVIGGITGQGTNSPITVIQNDNGSAIYQELSIGAYGTLAAPTDSDSYLKLGSGTPVNGCLNVYAWGTLQLGTSSIPISASNTCIIEFQCTTAGQYGLEVRDRGNFIAYGAEKTPFTFLGADLSASSTSGTLSTVPSGWQDGDLIVLPSTSRTSAECESNTLSGDVDSTSFSLISATSYAHSGSGDTVGEVANLTRNIQIKGLNDTTGVSYIACGPSTTQGNSSIVDLNYIQVTKCGINLGGKNCGILLNINGSALSPSIVNGCTVVSSTNAAIYGIVANNTSISTTFTNNISYLTTTYGICINQQSSGTCTVTGNLAIQNKGNYGIYINGISGDIKNNIATSGTAVGGILVQGTNPLSYDFTGNVCHSNNGYGIAINGPSGGSMNNNKTWRNTSHGLYLNFAFRNAGSIIDNHISFGNTVAGIDLALGTFCGKIEVVNSSLYSESSYPQQYGVYCATSPATSMYFNNCIIGPNSVADLALTTNGSLLFWVFNNCLFNSTVEMVNQSYLMNDTIYKGISSIKHNQISGNHKSWLYNGIISSDFTIYKSSAPSERLTSNNSSYKLISSNKFINVNAGDIANLSVYVRKSTSDDGTDYNGSQPRLILKSNYGLGITEDTILATASSDNGEWELLSGTISGITDDGVLEVYVDCDGDEGWINIDSWDIVYG